MASPNAIPAFAAILCLGALSCEGDVALFTSRPVLVPASGDAGPMESDGIDPPPSSVIEPPDASSERPPLVGMIVDAAVQPSGSDAAAPGTEPDANLAPAPVPEPVVVDGPAIELPRLGVEGGDPRRGICEGGVVVGVRTTANPSEEVFGQRLTFIEPICGKALHHAPGAGGNAAGSLSVTRDDSILAWSVTDGFLGVPLTEVPDSRLIWVLQPESICPEATPVVVGLAGEYDPVAPDVMDTAAIRSLFIECAPLVLAPNGIDVAAGESGHQLISRADSFAVGGSAPYVSACEGGAVTTQIKVHAGFWLDGFVLGCSRLRVAAPL